MFKFHTLRLRKIIKKENPNNKETINIGGIYYTYQYFNENGNRTIIIANDANNNIVTAALAIHLVTLGTAGVIAAMGVGTLTVLEACIPLSNEGICKFTNVPCFSGHSPISL